MSKHHVDKNKLKIMVKDSFFGIDQLSKDYGLKTKDIWYDSFDNASSKKVSYIRKMRKNGEQLNKKPRILLSTIHGVYSYSYIFFQFVYNLIIVPVLNVPNHL